MILLMRDFKIIGKTFIDKPLIQQLDYHSLLNFQTASYIIHII